MESGTLSPNPWDVTLSGQNDCLTLKAPERSIGHDHERRPMQTFSPDKVTSASLPLVKGCDPSAASGAGMANGRLL
jgi:hypothetical protein